LPSGSGGVVPGHAADPDRRDRRWRWPWNWPRTCTTCCGCLVAALAVWLVIWRVRFAVLERTCWADERQQSGPRSESLPDQVEDQAGRTGPRLGAGSRRRRRCPDGCSQPAARWFGSPAQPVMSTHRDRAEAGLPGRVIERRQRAWLVGIGSYAIGVDPGVAAGVEDE
jgi:hypothetical protein